MEEFCMGANHPVGNTEIAENHSIENKDETINKRADLETGLMVKVWKCEIANDHQKEEGFCIRANDSVWNTDNAEKHDIYNKDETINKQADLETGLNVQVGKCEVADEHQLNMEKSILRGKSKMGFRQKKKRDNTEATNLPKCGLSDNSKIRVRRCPHILPLDLGKVQVAPNINPDVGRIAYSVKQKNKKYLR